VITIRERGGCLLADYPPNPPFGRGESDFANEVVAWSLPTVNTIRKQGGCLLAAYPPKPPLQ
jgi:hypothetical protein